MPKHTFDIIYIYIFIVDQETDQSHRSNRYLKRILLYNSIIRSPWIFLNSSQIRDERKGGKEESLTGWDGAKAYSSLSIILPNDDWIEFDSRVNFRGQVSVKSKVEVKFGKFGFYSRKLIFFRLVQFQRKHTHTFVYARKVYNPCSLSLSRSLIRIYTRTLFPCWKKKDGLSRTISNFKYEYCWSEKERFSIDRKRAKIRTEGKGWRGTL